MELYLGFGQHIVSMDQQTTSQALAAGQGSTLVPCLVLIGVFFNNICLALFLAHFALGIPIRGKLCLNSFATGVIRTLTALYWWFIEGRTSSV